MRVGIDDEVEAVGIAGIAVDVKAVSIVGISVEADGVYILIRVSKSNSGFIVAIADVVES